MSDVFRRWQPCGMFVLFMVLPKVFESFVCKILNLSGAERQESGVLTRLKFSLQDM